MTSYREEIYERAGLSTAEANGTERLARWPVLGDDALYGLPGDVVRSIEPHSEADPSAILLNLLSAFGSMIGRGSWLEVGRSRHHAKINAVLMGESSKARKGMSWDAARDLLSAVDRDYMDDRVGSGLSSGEGLINAVRDAKYGTNKDGDEVLVDPGVSDKRLLVMEGEFANVLKQAQRDGNILSIVIRNLWDDMTVQTLTKDPTKATKPHVSVIGHITLVELQRLLSQSDASNGFANRFLWACVRRSKSLPYGGDWTKVDVASLVTNLRGVVRFGKDVGKVAWGPTSDDLWRSEYERLAEGQPGLFGAMTSRSEAQVVRLAMVYALMDMSRTIEEEHLKAALALWAYCEDSVRYVFGDATGDPVADAIEEALKAAVPHGLTRSEIRDALSRNVTSGKIGQALDLLSRTGRVECQKEAADGPGRPAERWYVR